MRGHEEFKEERLGVSNRDSLDPTALRILKQMYSEQIPELISTILRLKHSRRIDAQAKRQVEMINEKILKTVIQLLTKSEEFDAIFKRLKKEFEDFKNSGETQEMIIQWYTELFKAFSEDLMEIHHQDISEGLIENLNFDNAKLVKRIVLLVCMLSDKNEKYSTKVMEQLIDKFYIIRAQAKFDDNIKHVI